MPLLPNAVDRKGSGADTTTNRGRKLPCSPLDSPSEATHIVQYTILNGIANKPKMSHARNLVVRKLFHTPTT
jgi:hypothetical protein